MSGFDRERRGAESGDSASEPVAAGKRTLAEQRYVQRKARADAAPPTLLPAAPAARPDAEDPFAIHLLPQVQRQAVGDGGPVHELVAAHRVDRAQADGGDALPGGLRGQLEGALGADLSAVRVHTGQPSTDAADALQAHAYAVGQDIHFGAGAYDPGSTAGQHLIAHEVAHTVQQGAATPAAGVQTSSMVSSPHDAAEREADHFADRFVSGARTEGIVAAGQATATVHRFGRDEHKDIPTKHLHELYAFLATEEGERWATKHGQDAKQLRARMANDPVIKGEKLHGSKASNPGGAPTEYEYGDITALMGDLFGSWQDLQKASPEQRKGLLEANSTADYQKFSNGKYLELAAKNDDHFAVRNKESWLALHQQAIAKAMAAATDDALFEEALFVEAASTHFLTDAFSAGHQFEKAKLLTAATLDLQQAPIQTTNPQMQTYVAALGTANTAQLVVKLIHDRMNEEGFMVENGKGMQWLTLGDGNLARSPETQRIAALAVFESRQQVITTRGATKAPDVEEIAAYFPNHKTQENALAKAISYIPDARQKVEQLVYQERGSAPGELAKRVHLPVGKELNQVIGKVVGTVVESNLDTIGDPGREQQILRNQELDRAAGRDEPRVEPSFTIGRW